MFSSKSFIIAICLAIFMFFTSVSATSAVIPPPGQYFSFKVIEDGPVTAFFTGATAGYDDYLTVSINGVYQPTTIFNHDSGIGEAFSFGSALAGDSIVFKLTVSNTGDIFYSNSSLNLDGLNHYQATPLTIYTPDFSYTGVWVGAEDLYGGGDNDVDDLTFFITNTVVTAVPEPSMIIMLFLGLVGISISSEKRKRRCGGFIHA